jgi:hypothetical protein
VFNRLSSCFQVQEGRLIGDHNVQGVLCIFHLIHGFAVDTLSFKVRFYVILMRSVVKSVCHKTVCSFAFGRVRVPRSAFVVLKILLLLLTLSGAEISDDLLAPTQK